MWIGGVLAALLATAVLANALPDAAWRTLALGQRLTTSRQLSFVARTTSDISLIEDTETTGELVPIKNPVADGDTLIVTLLLRSNSTGPITARDTSGNRYQVVGDVPATDGSRLVAMALLHARALEPSDQITFDWPHPAHAYIPRFGSLFFAGPATSCVSGDLLFSAMESDSDPAPDYNGVWLRLPDRTLAGYRLTTALHVVRGTDPCSASGRAPRHWESVLLHLR